jgi:hypothetical protein
MFLIFRYGNLTNLKLVQMLDSGSPPAPLGSPPAQAPGAASASATPSPQRAQQELDENFRLDFQGTVRDSRVCIMYSNFVHFQNIKELIFF